MKSETNEMIAKKMDRLEPVHFLLIKRVKEDIFLRLSPL